MPIYEFICQDCGFQFEKLVLGSRDVPDMSGLSKDQCG